MLLDGSKLKVGDYAGISAFQSNRADIGLRRTEQGLELYAVLETPQREGRTVTRVQNEILRVPADGTTVQLRIRYDFDKDQAWLAFRWPLMPMTLMELQTPLQMRYTLDYFTGYRSALYCYATQELGGYAEFDYFKQTAGTDE